MCILIEVISRVHAKGGKSFNDLKFGTFIGRFPSDPLASMAAKGLKEIRQTNATWMPVQTSANDTVLQRTRQCRISASLCTGLEQTG